MAEEEPFSRQEWDAGVRRTMGSRRRNRERAYRQERARLINWTCGAVAMLLLLLLVAYLLLDPR